MTWYDGGPAPDPTRRDPEQADPAAPPGGAGRARLRVAAEVASAAARDQEPPPEDDPQPAAGHPAGGSRARLLDAVRWRVPSRTAVVALAALALVAGAVALRAAAQPTGEPVSVEEPTVLATAEPEPAVTTDATVWVHVVGQVASPGVVALPAGARVGEAVAAAGGALPDADLAGLNLAAVVADGAQVRVPAPGEAPEGTAAGAEGGGTAGGAAGGGTVDVNTAGSGELQTLPGIGPVLADRIVAWREEHGAFPDVDALRDVPGIGPAVLTRLQDLVRV
jgi:competence protein ComEA